jgi:integrase
VVGGPLAPVAALRGPVPPPVRPPPERTRLTATEISALAKDHPDQLRDLLVRDAAKLKAEGRLDSYVSKFFEGLKSYFRFHRIAFDGFPTLSPIKGASLANERVPTPEELARVLDHLTLRGRVLALFMAHSGVRPGVLGAYQGENGLRLSDLPDLKLGRSGSEFAEVPFVIRVPANLSKTRVAYVTFGTAQLASTFLAYLEQRRDSGEVLGPASPVVAANAMRGIARRSRDEAPRSKGFLTTKVVVEEIRVALRMAVPDGVRWRPYVLRAYCSTRLLMAEGAGKITHDLREAILGHDVGVAARYNVGKRWGEDLLKEARASFRRCEPYLSTAAMRDAADTQAQMSKVMLMGLGYTEEELAKVDFANLEVATFRDLVTKKMGRDAGADTARQRVVDAGELPGYLEQGWRVVTAVNEHQVVVDPPGG